jgi:sugar/nucleoside kinase (ribokinase family)
MPSRAGGDNVGCGDAYVAILVHGMTLGWDLEASGAAASRWAAEVASQRGATPLLSEDETTRLLLGESAEAEADRAPRH